MSNDNIFDLTALEPLQKQFKVQADKKLNGISKDEQDNMLIGYMEVPESKWIDIPSQSLIRYLRKDGNFRTGGKIISNSIMKRGRKAGQLVFYIQAENMPTKWSVSHSDLEKVWSKKNQLTELSANTEQVAGLDTKIKTMQETIDYLNIALERSKVDIAKLNNEQKRIINLIKKLHGIRSRSASPGGARSQSVGRPAT